MKTVNLIIALLLLITFSSFAQEVSKTGTAAATFLKIPVSARGVAMGGSFVSVVDDASSLYWNPGGLPRLNNIGLTFDHTPWLGGINFTFLGIAIPLEQFGSLGISVISMSTKEMEVTTLQNQMGTGETFDAASVAIGITYARSLTDRFTLGATFKFINERIYNSNASGIALDIGTIYDTPLEGLRLGFSISNFGTKMRIMGEDLNYRIDIAPNQNGNNQSVVSQLKTDEFDLPLIMRVGLSMDVWQDESNRLVISVDGTNPSDNFQSINIGAEWALFNEMVFLRGGFNEMFKDDGERGLTLGAGINYMLSGFGKIGVDYAWAEFGVLGDIQTFSFSFSF